MAKKRIKNLYAQHDVDWHLDARCQKIGSAQGRWINFVLWNICVKNQTDTLPDYMDDHYLAAQCAVDVRTFRNNVAKMVQDTNKLMTKNEDGTLTIHGVADIHETAKFLFIRRKPLADCSNDAASVPQDTSNTPRNSALNRTEQNRTEQNREIDPRVSSVFDHYFKIFKKTKATRLGKVNQDLIKEAFKRGHDLEAIKKAITAMSTDTWPDRSRNSGLVFAIGVRNKIDNVEKWATYEPEKRLTGGHRAGVPEKDKDYGTTTVRKL